MNQSNERIRVLQVDDEPQIAEVTAELLEHGDDRFAVETATDGTAMYLRLPVERADMPQCGDGPVERDRRQR